MKSNETYPKVYLYRRIVQAKLFIDAHHMENIDLNNISEEAHFSKFYFIRLFKKIYGKTPYQYLSIVRLEKAKQLLQNNVSVTNVCFSVGYESVSSFSELFKRNIGLSPSKYRIQQQKIKQDILKTPLNFIPNCFAIMNGWAEKSNFEEVIA